MTQIRRQKSEDPSEQPVCSDYQARVRAGEIEPDAAQLAVAEVLDELARKLKKNDKHHQNANFLARFSRASKPEHPRGIYMHGGVGRGKTMMMDLFFDAVAVQKKQRVHFHEFMGDIHDNIAEIRQSETTDPIAVVAERVLEKNTLLCFDELHVTDIADAMILARLFDRLFAGGLVVVATSNASPRDLYPDGLNRQLFLPFVGLIEKHMSIHELAALKDYRLDKLKGRALYFTPVNARARQSMDEHWERLTGHHAAKPHTIEVLGRTLEVPQASMGIARFHFNDLCAKSLGPRDYLHIAHAFHTILIDEIPILSPANRNEARRFINLIDTFYDCNVSLIASADAEPDALYSLGDGSDHFQRTASRLFEMRSEDYLQKRKERTRAKSSA